MKHHGLAKEERKTFKEKQIENLKKHYSDFSEDDWVLWIVPELFHCILEQKKTETPRAEYMGDFIHVT